MTVNPGNSPPVVFISQLGTDGASWKPVIDLLTCGSATVTYDRPGTGDCPPRPAPNPPLPYSVFADELAAQLDEHDISGPLVVVGHSAGSLIARMFAARYPQRTCGVVHVDGSTPRLSLWPAVDKVQQPDGDGSDATHFDRVAGEVEVVEAELPLLPAVVVTRTPGRWPADYPAETIDPLWTAYQRQLARQHGVPLIVAADAGHQIPREAPALVAYLVDQVVQAARVDQPCEPDPGTVAKSGGTVEQSAS